jgi:alpha-galactosidase
MPTEQIELEGHAAHTKKAEEIGLPGALRRPIKVTMLGAGSGFTPTIVNDILRIPGEQGGTIGLVDIDANRLETMQKVITNMAAQMGKTNWKVEASTDRTEVLGGTDYIVVCVEVSGLACVRHDNDIPAKYGIDQCIGDTIGPGGLFKALRTVPVFLDILKDAERLCPKAIVLNYTNPMNIMCLAAGRTSWIPVVGLCHSVQGTSHLLAGRAGVPYEEMVWECAGINHLAWFTKLEHNGKDLYPLLFEKARLDLAGTPSDDKDAWDLVRKDMMLHFGAFITESSGHLSEYLPYYRKRKDLLEQYARDAYDGGSSFYANNWPSWRAAADEHREKLVRGEAPFKSERSWEYGSWIIEAREKDAPYRIYGNVMNNVEGTGTLITNLPADGCVEVSCMIDRNGINPTRYGKLPAQMAGICDSNMRMFDLAATAIIERSKEAAIHALMLDPLSAAVCSPAEIKKMTLELFDAEQEFLPGYK